MKQSDFNTYLNEANLSNTRLISIVALVAHFLSFFTVEIPILQSNLQIAYLLRFIPIIYFTVLIFVVFIKKEIIKDSIQFLLSFGMILSILPVSYNGSLIAEIENNYFIATMGYLQVQFAFVTFITVSKFYNYFTLFATSILFALLCLIVPEYPMSLQYPVIVQAQFFFILILIFTHHFIYKSKMENFNKQEELKRINKVLEENVKSRDKYFSILSHDLINPIQAIMLTSTMLRNNYTKYSEEKLGKKIKTLHVTNIRLMNFVINILNWTRSQRGRIVFEPENVDIYEMINEIVSLYKTNAEIKNIEIEIQIQKGSVIFVDKNMIETVFRNLISNAIKFSEKYEKIRIVSGIKENNMIIDFVDRGKGIEPEEIEYLFLSEKRSKLGTSGEKGTGLGLILCKEFVERNNGNIKVDSLPGLGSTFTVTLPMKNDN